MRAVARIKVVVLLVVAAVLMLGTAPMSAAAVAPQATLLTGVSYFACDDIAVGYGVKKYVGNIPGICVLEDIAYLPFTGLSVDAKPSAWMKLQRDSYGFLVLTDARVDVPCTYCWANGSYVKMTATQTVYGALGDSNFAIGGTATGVRLTTGLRYSDRFCLRYYNYGRQAGVSRC